MPILLGAFGKELASLRNQRRGAAFETQLDSGHVRFELQAGAAGQEHFAAHGSELAVLALGEICDDSRSPQTPGSHSSCVLQPRVAEAILQRVQGAGRAAAAELHGTFAAALYDGRNGLLTLCRDRSGVQPLYYALAPAPGVAVVFSTSLRALAALQPRPRLAREACASFLTNGYVLEPLTMLAGARALLPGQSITIRLDGSVLETSVYRRSAQAARDGDSSAAHSEKAVRTRLVEIVSRQMPREGSCGLLLSGGVDSSTLAAVVRRDLGRPLHTFSLVFDDKELSESKYSRAVASKLGTEHHEVLLEERQFIQALDDALQSLDQPTTDAINGYYISKECKSAGMGLCLAGIGSDELFGGHECFQRVPKALRGLRLQRALPSFLQRAVRGLAARTTGGSPYFMPSAGVKGKFVSLLDQQAEVLPVYLLSRRVLLPELVAQLVAGETAGGVNSIPPELAAYLAAQVDGRRHILEELSVYEQVFYLCNQLLRDLQGVSTALGVRFRLPFVDAQLLETVGGLAPEQRFRGPLPKQLLIDSVKDILPTDAYLRPKLGFVLPIGRWLAGELALRLDALVEDEAFVRSVGLDPVVLRRVCQDCRAAGGSVFYTRLWSVFILLDWCKRSGLSAA